MTAEEQRLEALAAVLGITSSYHDGTGTLRRACDDAVLAVIRALGVEIDRVADADEALRRLKHARERRSGDRATADLPPLHVVAEGSGHAIDVPVPPGAAPCPPVLLVLESGDSRPVRTVATGDRSLRVQIPRDTPHGVHHLEIDDGRGGRRVIVLVAPPRLPAAERSWCLFAPLYALRSDDGAPVFGDLARLGRWMTQAHAPSERHRDRALLGTLPLTALFLDEPFEPSPYSPISRAFWNELYVDPAASPEFATSVLASHAGDVTATSWRSGSRVDYRGWMRERRRQIEALVAALDASGGARRDAIERALERDEELGRYAAFRAAVEWYAATWEKWPARARAGELRPGVDYDGETFRYHVYAQLLAREQIASAVEQTGASLYLDLPLGSHPGGYDTWRWRADFAPGVAFGAPPDAVFAGGQNWGFPPMHPERARASGYACWRAALRHHFEHASVLRVDHVMGLHRAFWIPDGFEATDGVYVRYPHDELWSVLAVEAAAARGGRGAAVIGEDLGTVPDEVRAEMHARGALRMHVVPFECRDDAEAPVCTPPRESMVCLGTHDMEPFASWWDAPATPRERIAAWLGCATEPSRVLAALLAWMSSSDATVVCANVEDFWLERERQNSPGSVAGDSSWQRPFARTFEDFTSDSGVKRLVDLVRGADVRPFHGPAPAGSGFEEHRS